MSAAWASLQSDSATTEGRFLISAITDDRVQTAAAPPTISEISCVIAAWRALL